jgi:hypothetical protein
MISVIFSEKETILEQVSTNVVYYFLFSETMKNTSNFIGFEAIAVTVGTTVFLGNQPCEN